MSTVYESLPMQIGKHEWRAVVKPSTYFPGEHVIEYQWRRYADDFWRRDTTWPTYNHNDGSYAGLPRTLRKLYDREKPQLAPFLTVP